MALIDDGKAVGTAAPKFKILSNLCFFRQFVCQAEAQAAAYTDQAEFWHGRVRFSGMPNLALISEEVEIGAQNFKI